MGLKNDWGTLSLGNQLDMTEEFVYLYNISAWASGYAIHQGDFDRMNGDRLPNSLKFLSNAYTFTPSLVLYGGYQHTRFEGNHWNQGSLGLHFLLSKRTDVYISGDYLRASDGVNAVIGYSVTPSSSNTQADVRIGIRHSF